LIRQRCRYKIPSSDAECSSAPHSASRVENIDSAAAAASTWTYISNRQQQLSLLSTPTPFSSLQPLNTHTTSPFRKKKKQSQTDAACEYRQSLDRQRGRCKTITCNAERSSAPPSAAGVENIDSVAAIDTSICATHQE
jgi:hypothetical protein